MESTTLPRRDGIERACELADCTVRSDGSGRVVEAYVAHFNPGGEEIRDAEGHYKEFQSATSFAKTLAERGTSYQVLFNHGRTFDMKTDGALMMPIGKPLEVRSDDYGVWSATEFLENPLADGTLDAIKKGAIRGYSYSGAFIKSIRRPPPTRGELPQIHRSEIAMREYGPVLFPAYAGALITGTRMQSFLDELRAADPEDLEAFRQLFGVTPGEPTSTDTPTGAVQTEDPPIGQSARTPQQRAEAIRARNTARGIRR